MFTGIIEEIGTISKLLVKRNLSVLKVRAKNVLKGARPGDSIAVDGVCLTVTDITKDVLTFDIMYETMLKTTLGQLKPREKVNLERALKKNGRFSGHFVTGHVDDTGTIKNKITKANYTALNISLTKGMAKSVVPKGSVSIDGISLTVGEVKKGFFTVYLIPFTKQVTTLGSKKINDKVNIETDILAKYILNRR